MRNITLAVLLVLNSMMSSAQVQHHVIPVSDERSRDFDALHYKVVLSLDPQKKILAGSNTITLRPLRSDLTEVILDAESLIVSEVLSGRESVPFNQSDSTITITLDRTYTHQDTMTFTVYYNLSEPVDGLRFIDALGDRPLQVSSNCFPNNARQWIPCFDYPNDKVSQEMIITTDSKYKVLSNGKLVGKDSTSNGTITWHWKQEKPHATYLINLSIADYFVVNDSFGDLPVNYWVYKSMAGDVERVFGKTPYMIDFFSRIFNYTYPWDKYDQVISGYMGGGAEATSATLLGEGIVTDEHAEQDYPREYVIAHEIAHHWWGDLITSRSWEHTWLNESFGTYSEHLYTLHDKGVEEGAYDLLSKKRAYLDEAHNRFMRPIVNMGYEQAGDNFNRHTYEKGACVIHLLRYILGDDTFFRTISTFLHRHEFQPVTTYDFMKCVKDVSGKNMDWFFEQYFFRPGHPVFNVSKSWDESEKKLKIVIIQEQEKWEGVPIYMIPVRIGIHTSTGKAVKEFWLKEKNEEISLELNSKPLMVRFDEGNYILKELTYEKSLDELLYQVNHDDLTGRLWAVEELAAFSDDVRTIECWRETAIGDDFWAVRAAAIERISKFQGAKNISLLKKSTGDKSSRVRTAAVKALGSLQDPSLKKFYKKIFRNDNSYAVKSETLLALGKCGNKTDISFIRQAGMQESYGDVVKKAAQKALALISSNQTNE
ncbi:MAG: M1 family metallopeptidase [Cyclobacteriaceae bacterium]